MTGSQFPVTIDRITIHFSSSWIFFNVNSQDFPVPTSIFAKIQFRWCNLYLPELLIQVSCTNGLLNNPFFIHADSFELFSYLNKKNPHSFLHYSYSQVSRIFINTLSVGWVFVPILSPGQICLCLVEPNILQVQQEYSSIHCTVKLYNVFWINFAMDC